MFIFVYVALISICTKQVQPAGGKLTVKYASYSMYSEK